MILRELLILYENLLKRNEVAARGWCHAKVSYEIALSPEGKILGVFSLKTEETRGKKTVFLPQSIVVPEMVTRSSGVSSNFLCDNSKYMLGIDRNGTDQRTVECFKAAKEKHMAVLSGSEGEIPCAVRSFFENWDPENVESCAEAMRVRDDITDGGNIIFSVKGVRAQEDSRVRDAWNKYYSENEDGESAVCLVTGEHCRISRLHKAIKGVAGAQSSGAPLVSFNAPAFESYGKEQSYNAPVGRYAEFAYTTALNYLLDQKKYVFRIADATVVFWAESAEPVYQDFFSMAIDPPDNQEEIRNFFERITSHKAVNIDNFKLNPDQSFCILGLSPNAARLSIRFFYKDTFGNIIKNISRHYDRMRIVKPAWENREYLGVWAMLAETRNKNSSDSSQISNMAAAVLKAILSDSRYPASLYSDTLIRIRAEQGKVTWGRASIIKAYLIKNYAMDLKGEKYMGSDTDNKDRAYLLGRLFSVLEAIQKEANPNINATITDRYFNSACSTPASTFPILVRLKNSHMKKIERDKPTAKIYYEKLLSEIMGKLECFPHRLSLEEQGMFILGYYHQTQKRYEKKEDK